MTAKGESGEDNVLPFVRREASEPPRGRRNRGKSRVDQSTPAGYLNASSDWKYYRGFKPGQILQCRIVRAVPGGFDVLTIQGGLRGYLPSDLCGYLQSRARHNVGDEVLAAFVCFDRDRVLLSERVPSRYGPDWAALLDSMCSAENESDETSSTSDESDGETLTSIDSRAGSDGEIGDAHE